MSARGGFLGYAIIGFLVGVLPVALGLLWLPSLRRVDQRWLTAFMAMTAGLLSFLGVEALFEAFQLQGALPGAFGGAGLVLLGVATSFLTMTFISGRFSAQRERSPRRRRTRHAGRDRDRIAQLRRRAGDRNVVRVRQLTLGSFLIVGFMIHNVTEGLGIAAPAADGGASLSLARLAALASIAGGPAILGAWTGGFVANDVLGGALLRRRRGRRVRGRGGGRPLRRAEGSADLRSGYAVGGFLAGIAIMYVTGLLAA